MCSKLQQALVGCKTFKTFSPFTPTGSLRTELSAALIAVKGNLNVSRGLLMLTLFRKNAQRSKQWYLLQKHVIVLTSNARLSSPLLSTPEAIEISK